MDFKFTFSSIQLSCSVVSDSLQPHESQHARLPCAWGGQSTGVSALASFLPKKFQGWSPSEWIGWISLQSKGLWRVFSNTTIQNQFFWHSAFFIVQLSHPYMVTGKAIALTAAAAKSLQSCLTLCRPMDWSTPGFPVLHYFLEFSQTHVHWVGDSIQTSHPLLSPSPPALNLSQHQGLFSNESALPIRKPKYWSFSFSISPSNEYSELISFRMDWLDLQNKNYFILLG